MSEAGAARMRGFSNSRHVLHLERLRARRLDEHRRGVRAHQVGDGRADAGIIVRGLHVHLREITVAEGAGGSVGGIRHQQMVAGLERRHQRHRDGGKSRGRRHGAGGARQFRPRAFERGGGRRALGAIGKARGVGSQGVRVGVKDRGPAIDGGVDESELLFGRATRVQHAGAAPELRPALGINLAHRAWFLSI